MSLDREALAELRSLLERATPGPWEVDGPPNNQIIWSDSDNRVCFMAHTDGEDDDRDIATAALIVALRNNAAALLDIAERATLTTPAGKGKLRWRPFIHRRDVPTGEWFVARSTKLGWSAVRIVRYDDNETRLPTDGTGWMWPSEPTEWLPLAEYQAAIAPTPAPQPEGAAEAAGEVEHLRAKNAELLDQMRACYAQHDHLSDLLGQGVYSETEDETVPLLISDESDASVGMDGRWSITVPRGWQVVRASEAQPAQGVSEDEVRRILAMRAFEHTGDRSSTGLKAWCRANNVVASHAHDFANGKRGPLNDLLAALGLERGTYIRLALPDAPDTARAVGAAEAGEPQAIRLTLPSGPYRLSDDARDAIRRLRAKNSGDNGPRFGGGGGDNGGPGAWIETDSGATISEHMLARAIEADPANDILRAFAEVLPRYVVLLAARPQPEGAPDALVARARRIAYEIDAADRYKGWDAETLARHESEFGRKADYERGEYDAGQLVRCALAALTAHQMKKSQ